MVRMSIIYIENRGVLAVVKDVKRKFSLDFLRIVAVCAVVMIHISADFIKEFENSTSAFLFGNIFVSISRFAVPVFLMISGALMLDENKELPAKRIIKSTKNILILTFSWSLLYAIGYDVIKPILFDEPFSVWDFLDTLFNGHYHMWYLFVLMGLYLITPLLRSFIKKENERMIRNYLVLSVVICFVASLINEWINSYGAQDVVSEFVANFRLDCIYEYLVYYILGWYVANVGFKGITRIFIYIGGFIGLIVTLLGTHFYFGNYQNGYFFSNNSPNILLYSLAVFVFVYYLFESKQYTLNAFWLKASRLTFGVYLIHCAFLFVLKRVCERLFDSALLEILATFVGGVVLSFIAVFIISKIPLIKKLIRE